MEVSTSKSVPTSFFIALCFVVLIWNDTAWSHSLDQPLDEIAHALEEKVYVTPDQIEVTENGIVFHDPNTELLILGETLSYDENGLFLKPIPLKGPCGLHSTWCRYCKGCGVIYCPMKCTCPNGVGGKRP